MTGIEVRRVLQVHTRYRAAGGEDAVVAAERRLLADSGVEVEQLLFDNAELKESRSLGSDLRLATSTIWSRSAHDRARAAIRRFRPEVIHVHNTFPSASPSVYAAAATEKAAVVQTLHNYRFICPAGTLFRDGHPCTDCVGRIAPWPSVVHACYQASRVRSAVIATMLSFHRSLGTYRRGIDIYVAVTEFQRGLMVAGGLPADRIRVIPNFLEPDPGFFDGPRTGFLFLGRLSEEKGVATLLDAARRESGHVRIAGIGPLKSIVEAAAADRTITYLGFVPHSAVGRELGSTMALVLPSMWFEGMPMSVLEAWAVGTPVIASRIGSLAEIVDDGVTGLLFEPGGAEQLAERIRWALDHPVELREMGISARRRYEALYRGPAHLTALIEAYAAAARPRVGTHD